MRVYTFRTRFASLPVVRVPVTFRVEQDVLDALDLAVRSGVAPTRAAAVEAAVTEWIARHDEEAIVESYRRAYAEPDPEHEALMEAFLIASAEAIFGEEGGDAPR